MKPIQPKRRLGFTLVEIMIVLAIVALLAAIAVPNLMRARKRAQATRMLNDLRVIDYALDRWTIEKNKVEGDVAIFADLKPYLKDSSQIYQTGRDLLGFPLGPYHVNQNPRITPSAWDAFSDVAPAEFWSPYYY
jgi:prepilin-type N-terminal cleavage/methylation domain-containing protein